MNNLISQERKKMRAIDDIVCDLLFVKIDETTLKKRYCSRKYKKDTYCYCTKEMYEVCAQKEEHFLNKVLEQAVDILKQKQERESK